MADHPFDEIAVDAAVKAFSMTGMGYRWNMNNALTAACKSMRERGLMTVEQKALLRIGDNMPYEGPVTIIRHNKEQP